MRRIYRRTAAYLHFLRKPVLGFLPLLIGTMLVVLVGAFFYVRLQDPPAAGQEPLTFGKAAYLMYCMLFMEHAADYPHHPLLQVFYWLVPLLGLVVVLDGVVRFSSRILRRDEHGKEWIKAVTKTYSDHVILVGLGKVGVRVLQQLLTLGESVVVLEKDAENPGIAFAKRNNVPVLIGSGREEGTTDQLNVAKAKSIILATDDDLANLEFAMDARQANENIRVVLRMYDQDLASKIRDAMDIQQAFSTSEIAAPVLATSSSDRTIVNAFYVKGRLLVVSEMEVTPNSKMVGRCVRDLRNENHIFVVAHERDQQIQFYPGGDTEIRSGDRVTLQTEPKMLSQVHEWNGGQPA